MRSTILFCTLASNAIAASASAAPLFSFQVSVGGSQPGTVSSISFPTQFSGNTTYLQNSIFATASFSLADIGKTMTIDKNTDPNFNAFLSKLTDAQSEVILFWFVPAPAVNISGVGWPEQVILFNDANHTPVDLHGQVVDYLSLHLNSFSYTNSDLRSSFQASITFSGGTTVPEPCGSPARSLRWACSAGAREGP